MNAAALTSVLLHCSRCVATAETAELPQYAGRTEQFLLGDPGYVYVCPRCDPCGEHFLARLPVGPLELLHICLLHFKNRPSASCVPFRGRVWVPQDELLALADEQWPLLSRLRRDVSSPGAWGSSMIAALWTGESKFINSGDPDIAKAGTLASKEMPPQPNLWALRDAALPAILVGRSAPRGIPVGPDGRVMSPDAERDDTERRTRKAEEMAAAAAAAAAQQTLAQQTLAQAKRSLSAAKLASDSTQSKRKGQQQQQGGSDGQQPARKRSSAKDKALAAAASSSSSSSLESLAAHGEASAALLAKRREALPADAPYRKLSSREKASRHARELAEGLESGRIVNVFPELRNAVSGEGRAVRMSAAMTHTAGQVRITGDGTVVQNSKGYRLAKSTHGFSEGTYLFSLVWAKDSPPRSNVRVGVAQISADLQSPLGYDAYGVAWRGQALDGNGVADSVALPGGGVFVSSTQQPNSEGGLGLGLGKGFLPGETLTFLVHLPECARPPTLPPPFEGAPTNYNPHVPVPVAGPLARNPGSFVAAWRDGVFAGVLRRDLSYGKWYVGVSCFGGARVEVLMDGGEAVDGWRRSEEPPAPLPTIRSLLNMSASMTATPVIASPVDDAAAAKGADLTANSMPDSAAAATSTKAKGSMEMTRVEMAANESRGVENAAKEFTDAPAAAKESKGSEIAAKEETPAAAAYSKGPPGAAMKPTSATITFRESTSAPIAVPATMGAEIAAAVSAAATAAAEGGGDNMDVVSDKAPVPLEPLDLKPGGLAAVDLGDGRGPQEFRWRPWAALYDRLWE